MMGNMLPAPQANARFPSRPGRNTAWPGPPPADSRKEVLKMQAAAQHAEAARILVLLAAIAIVAFWRTLLRLVIIFIVTVTIAVIGYGAIAVWQNMHHITG